MQASRRIHAVLGHIDPQGAGDDAVVMRACSAEPRLVANVQALEDILTPADLRDLKHKIYGVFRGRPDLLPAEEEAMSKEEHRELVRQCLSAVISSGVRPLTMLVQDPRKYYYMSEVLAPVDLSTTIKFGVQFSLWGGSVAFMGTAEHHRKWLDDTDALRLPGCFAMTELGHGSNVQGLRTEAVLDKARDEWVVNTPDESAIKWWIGNAAQDGRMSTVFARLLIPDAQGSLVDHGVHALVVPIRDEAGHLLPGVEIRDCGYKVGLNGIDNGAIRYTNVRVPRSYLLNKFGSVNSRGEYESSMSPAKRFGATLGALTGGRVGLVSSSLGVLKSASMIAVRYALLRRQFGPPGAKQEVAILDYQTHQRRLMPIVATAYAVTFARDHLVDMFCEMKRTNDPELVADVHALSAGLKAWVTSYTALAINTCRESCGGHGFAACNRLGAWRSDHDIFQTFEGDNTVLLQQVSTLLLKQYQDRFAGSTLQATFHYLAEAAGRVMPHNPLTTHETDRASVRNHASLLKALDHRAGRLLQSVAARLAGHAREGGEWHAWNECLTHLVDLANAHVERVVFGAFLAKIDTVKDAESKRVLSSMAELFALDRLHADPTLRNEEFVAPPRAKAMEREVRALCGELRTVAEPLVEAFDVPDFILRAPIGLHHSREANLFDEYLAAVGFGVGQHVHAHPAHSAHH